MDRDELMELYPLGAQRPVLVTEVTQMVGQVCVAAIDIHAGTVVRPLDSDGSNWKTEKWYGNGPMQVGAVLGLTAAPKAPVAFPHGTEDMRLTGTVNTLGALTEEELLAICIETADDDVASIFGGELVDRKYVPENTVCRSLGCVLVDKATILPHVPFDKVRVQFRDAANTYYELPITEMATRQLGDAQTQLAAVQQRIASFSGNHPVALRLGLTRPFAGFNHEYDPRRCILQLNGIIGVS